MMSLFTICFSRFLYLVYWDAMRSIDKNCEICGDDRCKINKSIFGYDVCNICYRKEKRINDRYVRVYEILLIINLIFIAVAFLMFILSLFLKGFDPLSWFILKLLLLIPLSFRKIIIKNFYAK